MLVFCLAHAVAATATPAGRKSAPHHPAAAGKLPAAARGLLRQAQPDLWKPGQPVAIPRQFDRAGVVELYHLRYERVDDAGSSWQVIQRVFDLRTTAGARFFGVDDLWYDGSRTHFKLLRATVLRHGKVIGEGKDGGDSIPGATGNRSRRLVLPHLRAGDRVDVVYALVPAYRQQWRRLGDRYLGDLFAFRGGYPVVRVKYVLHARRRLGVSAEKLAAPVTRQRNGEWSWSWSGGPYQPFFSDPGGPSITDRSPFVQVSGFGSWPALVAWYQGELARRARMSSRFRQHLLELVPPRDTQLATVHAVWAYLSEHLGYRGVEDGVHAYVPSPVEQVFQQGEGDCKDGSLLLATWLRAEGVPAYVALVRTRPMGRLAGAATMAAFDHAVVTVPSLGLWIDTTAPDFRAPDVPSSDQDGLALIVRAGTTGLTRIPVAPVEENVTRRVVKMHPEGGGWYVAEGEIAVKGADTAALRRSYGSDGAPARRQVFDRWLRRLFPHARVEQVRVEGLRGAGCDPAATPGAGTACRGGSWIHLQFRARIHPKGGMDVAWIRRDYERTLAMEGQRRRALRLPLRWMTDETWELDGVNPADCPQELTRHRIEGQFGTVTVEESCRNGRLVVHSRVVQPLDEVKAGDYGRFRRFWRNADRLLNSQVVEEPAEGAEVAGLAPAPVRDVAAGEKVAAETEAVH